MFSEKQGGWAKVIILVKNNYANDKKLSVRVDGWLHVENAGVDGFLQNA